VTDFCFNPRAREGRDHLAGASVKELVRVSIHAPVKGATAECFAIRA